MEKRRLPATSGDRPATLPRDGWNVCDLTGTPARAYLGGMRVLVLIGALLLGGCIRHEPDAPVCDSVGDECCRAGSDYFCRGGMACDPGALACVAGDLAVTPPDMAPALDLWHGDALVPHCGACAVNQDCDRENCNEGRCNSSYPAPCTSR